MIFIASTVAPKNGASWPVVEDKYIRGGFQLRNTVADRDAVDALVRKNGMLVYTLDTAKLYQLQSDLTSWLEFTATPASHQHAAAGIVTDAANRFITDLERSAWDAKQPALGFLAENSANKGAANGYPGLDALGKMLTVHLPDLAITNTFVVASEVEMLAIACQIGDVAVRTDLVKTFILKVANATVLANWQELLVPTAGVVSVSVLGPINNSGTVSAPLLSIPPATAIANGYMTAVMAAKLDGVAANANNYVHPTSDGNLHVPATSTTNNGKVLTAGATAGSLSWTLQDTGVQSITANAPITSSGGATPVLSIPAATSANAGYLSSADWITFNSKGTGTITSVTGSGALSVTGIAALTVSLANATTLASGGMSAADKLKLDGIATSANNYAHPTGDGSLHVPATGTSSNGMVLTAGATAGSLSWTTPAAGAVTSVTANSPVTSSGGAAPVISMPAATSSVSGYLSATDWVVFNSKGTGTITGVVGSGPISISGITALTVSIAAATTVAHGSMSAADKTKLDSITAGATAYTHPTGDGDLHVPVIGTTNSGKVLTAGATAGSMTWSAPNLGTVTAVTANSPVTSSGGTAPVISMPAATSSVSGYLSSADWITFNSKGAGTVVSVAGQGPVLVTGTANAPILDIVSATTTVRGTMSAADKTKLDGITAGATAYTHPTGDGDLHVPATSTTNSGKVLTAGATAGSLSWATPAASGVTAVTANAPITSSGGTTPVLSMSAATSANAGYLTAADWITFNSKGAGTVTSVGGTGSINGLTLTGTVTGSGSLSLGGSITSVATTGNFQMNSLGVGVAASGTAGDIRATGDVTAFYSDGRLKNVSGTIQNALSKVEALNGVVYTNNAIANQYGYLSTEEQVGVIAQDVAAVLPQVVTAAPFDIAVGDDGVEFSRSGEDYMTVRYERLVPLLIEAIKELSAKVTALGG